MYKKCIIFIIIFILIISFFGFVNADIEDKSSSGINMTIYQKLEETYGIQWSKNYGPGEEGGRFEGPQPIGDCDNDGENEIIISGRDATLVVMKWDDEKQNYLEVAELHSPFYQLFLLRQKITGNPPPDAGGFAIGDVTGDGENEIVATWYGAVYKYISGSYKIIGLNSWIFRNGGANGDCYIGDCDNDGQNEIIMSGGSYNPLIDLPEIVILKWNGLFLEKVGEYDDPVFGYAFMAGLGDVDNDGENEIAVGITNFEVRSGPGPTQYHKVVVLEWIDDSSYFNPIIIYETNNPEEWPFGGWCADSDMDGKDEIHVGFLTPKMMIFEWNNENYTIKYEKEWPGEGMLIESLNVGDVDNDGSPEVCAGTDIVHILQWDGFTYVEEAVINDTYGDLAVLNIGDCDNDGKNEINVAPVFVEEGVDYMSWIFKYGWES